MSRPSWLLPIDSIDTSAGCSRAKRVQDLGQLGVTVEAIESDVGHCVRARRGEVCRPAHERRKPVATGAILRHRPRRPLLVCTQSPPAAGQKARTTVYSCGMASPDLLPAYAELHCLSNFSFLRGASHPEELVERAQSAGLRGARDHRRMLARGRRARASRREGRVGLPLVIGSELTLADGMKLVLLATDRASYGDLSQLITRGRRNAVKGTYALDARRRRGSSHRRASRCGFLRSTCAQRAGSDDVAMTQAGSRDVFADRGADRRRIARAGRAIARGSHDCRACRKRPACRSSRQATCTCTCARAARCRTRSRRSA